MKLGIFTFCLEQREAVINVPGVNKGLLIFPSNNASRDPTKMFASVGLKGVHMAICTKFYRTVANRSSFIKFFFVQLNAGNFMSNRACA